MGLHKDINMVLHPLKGVGDFQLIKKKEKEKKKTRKDNHQAG